MTMDALARLVAVEEIGQVKARYCTGMDDHDWPLLRSVFTDDATFGEITGTRLDGPDHFVDWISSTMSAGIKTTHHVHNCQVTFLSDTEARVRFDLFADIYHRGEGKAPFRYRSDWGFYEDQFRKTATGWRIARLTETLTHTIVSAMAFGGPPLPKPRPTESVPPQIDTVTRLAAAEDIRQLKARYCAAVDDKDWTTLRTVFADDAAMGPMMGNTFDSPDVFITWMRGNLDGIKTVHHVHNPQIEFVSDTEAKGRWRLEFWNWFGNEPLDGGHGFADYREHYRLTPSGWRIIGFNMAPTTASSPAPGKAPAGLLTDLERLDATAELRMLKARYCAAVDDRDWQALRGVFTNDATFGAMRASDTNQAFAGPDDFVAWLARVLPPNFVTAHHVHNFQVEFQSATDAAGRWELFTPTWVTGSSAAPFTYRAEWGTYRDRYRKTADGWRIASFGGTLVHATELQTAGRTPPWTAFGA